MRSEDVYVGGVYRIRQWDDMAEEFGTSGGDILCHGSFVENMAELCGMEVTVRRKNTMLGICDVDVEYADGIERGWTITADMIEPVRQEEELTDVDPASIFDFLGV